MLLRWRTASGFYFERKRRRHETDFTICRVDVRFWLRGILVCQSAESRSPRRAAAAAELEARIEQLAGPDRTRRRTARSSPSISSNRPATDDDLRLLAAAPELEAAAAVGTGHHRRRARSSGAARQAHRPGPRQHDGHRRRTCRSSPSWRASRRSSFQRSIEVTNDGMAAVAQAAEAHAPDAALHADHRSGPRAFEGGEAAAAVGSARLEGRRRGAGRAQRHDEPRGAQAAERVGHATKASPI